VMPLRARKSIQTYEFQKCEIRGMDVAAGHVPRGGLGYFTCWIREFRGGHKRGTNTLTRPFRSMMNDCNWDDHRPRAFCSFCTLFRSHVPKWQIGRCLVWSARTHDFWQSID